MFESCSSLKTLNVSSFNTGSVTDMSMMFRNCSSLTALDVKNFHTENVTDMDDMFKGCSSLKELDLSSFRTEKNEHMMNMFYGCSALASLNVSGFNTRNTKYMLGILTECGSLETIALGADSVFTSNPSKPAKSPWTRVKTLSGTAANGPKINKLTDYTGSDPGWYVVGGGSGQATTPETKPGAAEDAKADATVKVGTVLSAGKGKYKVTAAGEVQYTAPTSKTAKVSIPATISSGGKTFAVTSIAANAFKGNKKITTLTGGANVKVIGKNAFNGCKKLKSVSLGAKVTTISDQAFYGCKKLKSVTIPAATVKIGKKAFYNCKKLKTIVIRSTGLKAGSIGKKAFGGIYKKAVFKVPKALLKDYKALLKKAGATGKKKFKGV